MALCATCHAQVPKVGLDQISTTGAATGNAPVYNGSALVYSPVFTSWGSLPTWITGSVSAGVASLSAATGLTSYEYDVLGVNGSGAVGLYPLTNAYLPSGSGTPTVTVETGNGSAYTATTTFASTGTASQSIIAGTNYRLSYVVSATPYIGSTTSAEAVPIKVFLYDTLNGMMIPGSKTDVAPFVYSSSTPNTIQITGSTIYQAAGSGSDPIQIWAALGGTPANASGVGTGEATINAVDTSLTAEQVSSSSTETQQSYSFPSGVSPVVHYDMSALSGAVGSSISSVSDTGSAGLSLSAGTTAPTIAEYWNGMKMAAFGSSTSQMTTASLPLSSVSTFYIGVVCSLIPSTSQNIVLNGTSGTNGVQIATGTSASTYFANNPAGGGNLGSTYAYPTNGVHYVEFARTSGGVETEWIDGIQAATSSSPAPVTPTGKLYVGSSPSSTLYIGEIVILSAPPSSANQTALQSYEMGHWRIVP